MNSLLARRLLLAAIALGIAGDQLLRAHPWRLGFVLWVLGLVAVALAATPAASAGDPRRPFEHRLLVGSAAVVALLLVLRDAPSLYAVDFFALLVVAGVIGWRALGRPLSVLQPRDGITGGLSAMLAAMIGGPLLATRDAAPGELAPTDGKRTRNLLVGTVLAAPLLLVVAGLLGEADPVFDAFIDRVAELLDISLIGHIVLSAALTWISAGALRGAIVNTIGTDPFAKIEIPRISFTTMTPALYGLVILLSIYIGLQVRVMFGGAEYVVATSGLTFAEYARRGFFELVVVSGLVFAVLLVADETLDHNDEKEERSFRTAGYALLALVAVMMVSAMQRLGLYVSTFGLTDDRFLAASVLIWLALVMGWFGWTVLRHARVRFAPGVLAISAGWLLVLNGINPEARIVSVNLARAEAGKSFDVPYHVSLSGDAVPGLLAGIGKLTEQDAAALRSSLLAEWTKRGTDREDWRSWSISFRRARSAVGSTVVASTGP